MRLRDLDPYAVGWLAAELVREHVTLHTLRLYGSMVGLEEYARDRALEVEVLARRLTEYAQRGPTDHVSSQWHATVGMRTLTEALCSSPMSRGGPLDATPDSPLGVVTLAALCRIKIADGNSVSLQELAALSSRSVHAVQSAIQRGRLPVTGRARGVRARIAARDALEWLDTLAGVGRDSPGERDKDHARYQLQHEHGADHGGPV